MKLSHHFINRSPSSIRRAQIKFNQRKDKESIDVINLAIGNISMPIYPAMRERLMELGTERFSDGIIKYTPTPGIDEARNAFLNILTAEGLDASSIFSMVTDGGSAAMELMLLGVCGPSSSRPLLILDPTYTNYTEFSKRLSIPTISTTRVIDQNGEFTKINAEEIESLVIKHNAAGILCIPYDNPTGQFLSQDFIMKIAEIAVKHDIWLISDEAYRSMFYKDEIPSSVWSLSEKTVKGITGRRISIESASKVWNACGLRIGGLLTDNKEFHEKAISEYTANLCANALGQEIFGAMASEPHENIRKWQDNQREYYRSLLFDLKNEFQNQIPGLIVTQPEAAIYFILDLKNLVDDNFHAEHFIDYCATKGKVDLNGKFHTLLLAPMSGFYIDEKVGKCQLRVAMVDTPDRMRLAPKLLSKLFTNYVNE